jgi:serine-type D-Ala-D-Ala carboxypeptidase/endopeptidase
MTGRRVMIFAAAFVLLAGAATAQTNPGPAVPSDSEIRKILADRIDTDHQSVGIVVGVIEPAGNRVVTYGNLEKGDKRTLNGDTVFEIGSVTKVFTSLELADMVQRGEVALSDPVARYLPPEERGGRTITLEDLSTHTSGLPRLPTNLAPNLRTRRIRTPIIRSTSSISFFRVIR